MRSPFSFFEICGRAGKERVVFQVRWADAFRDGARILSPAARRGLNRCL